MTMPYERARAVRQARELLMEITTGRLELEALKVRAIAILRHYPGDMDMSIAAARAPTIFSEGFVASLSFSDSDGLSEFDALVDASPVALPEPSRAEMEKQAVDAVLNNTKWLTTEMVGKRQNPDASNMHNAAHRWKKAGKIFSIERAGQTLYPLYAFDELGNPIPEVAEILKIFKGYRPFRIASWFESTNTMLHGKRPREVLGSDPAAVVEAAKDHVVGAAHG
ncbi:hypothetical protein F6X40_05955 [Paraburkholderia sp. UCT31]|uniref:BPSL0761 family protein n=1 Tax=Paraburkholderia sp. UCT31 TaxID=2615209 RepID=UPI0016557501|nr:BPSL0761 family protein [Paraburkholderia sp. UCT31]MBC8736381.1 hypothetical protein [Paraburkholderia sp. UCT31]